MSFDDFLSMKVGYKPENRSEPIKFPIVDAWPECIKLQKKSDIYEKVQVQWVDPANPYDKKSSRFYYAPYSTEHFRKLPSVTSVVGATANKEYLTAWKKRTPDHAQITANAARRGTALHESVEKFCLHHDTSVMDNKHFKQVYPVLSRISRIQLIECALYAPLMSVAGTIDMLAYFDGKLSVIDFKTAREEKESHMIEDYYIQETLYAMMLKEILKVDISQIVTIMAIDRTMDESEEAKVFIEDTSRWIPFAERRLNEFHFDYARSQYKGAKQDR